MTKGAKSLDTRAILLAGATATGKSEVAMLLAEKLGGEIVSVDSMQVYRGMDIGTAKAGAEERRRVPHHLIDVVDISEPFDVAKFARLAHEAVDKIRGRGCLPILCGGTGLYFKGFLEGVGEAPAANAALRADLEKIPLAELLCELKERDSITYEKIDRQNPRRVIRAIEVIRITGKPFSGQRAVWKSSGSGDVSSFPCYFGLLREAKDLHSRIDARVEQMFQQGLVDEVRDLMQRGLDQNKNAMQAIGYRQVAEHLRGERSLPDTIELVKVRTRQFAKRQITWFKRHASLEWIRCGPRDTAEGLAGQIIAAGAGDL